MKLKYIKYGGYFQGFDDIFTQLLDIYLLSIILKLLSIIYTWQAGVTIMAKGGKVRAHQFVLAAASPFFR